MPAPKDPQKYAEYIERLRQSHLGKRHSAETRAKMSASQKGLKTGVPRPDMRGNKNPMRRPDIAAKMGASHRGRPKSPEQRTKIAEALRGRKLPPEHRAKLMKENPGYQAVHRRVDYERGKAREHLCAICNGPAHGWALKIGRGQTKRNSKKPLMFSLDSNDYIALCQPCHRKHDYGLL